MNECLHREKETDCDFYKARTDLDKRCFMLNHDILDYPICQNPWHGMTAETVNKIKQELKNEQI